MKKNTSLRFIVAKPQTERERDQNSLYLLANILDEQNSYGSREKWAAILRRYLDDDYARAKRSRPSEEEKNSNIDILFWLYQRAFNETGAQSAKRIVEHLKVADIVMDMATIRTGAQREARRRAARHYIATQLKENRDCYRRSVFASLIEEHKRHVESLKK